MPYNRRPLNPLTPFVNQVVVESNAVNENFNILAQAFVSDNPETHKVKEADTVDGFHASLTPMSHVIVPLNADGVLDLSQTYIKSNVYTFRRIDLTNATSDYNLQIGEEALIIFTNALTVPLRIRTQSGTRYEVHLVCSNIGGVSGGSVEPIFLLPNNITYPNVFAYAEVYRNMTGLNSGYASYSAFRCGLSFSNAVFYITNFTQYKNIKGFYDAWGIGSSFPWISVFSCDWLNRTIDWVQLGTLVFPALTSGYVLIRRLA